MATADWAFVVGIQQYTNKGRGGHYKDLNGPTNDAKAFLKWLEDPLGGALPQRQIKRLLSPPVTKRRGAPMDGEIRDALKELVDQACDAARDSRHRQRRLYLFAAGHGCVVRGRGDETALLAANSRRPHDIWCLELRVAMAELARRGIFEDIILFPDCCRVDETHGDPTLFGGWPEYDRERPSRLWVGFGIPAGGRALEDIFQVGGRTVSRGIFSRCLMESLRPGQVDWSMLERSIKAKHKELEHIPIAWNRGL